MQRATNAAATPNAKAGVPPLPPVSVGKKNTPPGEREEMTADTPTESHEVEQIQHTAKITTFDLKKMEKLSRETTEKLHIVWDDMGLSEEERVRQLNSLVESVEKVFHQKVADEVTLRDEYFNAAEALEREIDDNSALLGMERQFFPHGDAGNLMLKLTWLRSHLVQFKTVREERTSKLVEMESTLRHIWEELGQDPEEKFANIEDFLTLEGMEDFQARVVQAQHDRTIRIASIQETIRDIVALFERLQYDVTSDFDRAILEGGESLGIDMDVVEALSTRARELTTEESARTDILKQLGAKISPLWEKLNVSKEERRKFFDKNSGLGLSVIQQCEKELQRLLEVKQQRMGDLIQDAQEKIQALWDEMHYDDEQREAFTQAHMLGRICEETLEAHEEEIAILTIQAELYRPILKSIEKYFQLCEERNEYEEKIKDSSRLLSRQKGFYLRDEEQQRQRVTKGIPRTIERIKAAIKEYEEVHGPFLLNGVRFDDTIDANEAAHLEKVEEEKQRKQKAKQNSKEDPLRMPITMPIKTPKKAQNSQRQRAPLSSKND